MRFPTAARPIVVLDTQVVLDWLVFRDPVCAALTADLEAGRLCWLASVAMRAEFDHVLGRGVGAARQPDHAAIDQAWRRWSMPAGTAPAAGPSLVCRDATDQMFIDLAVTAGARWLVTRDRALLALKRRAALRGVTVLEPSAWAATTLQDAFDRVAATA